MNDAWAVCRIERETISCNSCDESVHCAVSSDIPRHTIGTDSKSSAGGGTSVGGFASTFTAGVLDAEDIGLLGAASGPTWTPSSRHSRIPRTPEVLPMASGAGSGSKSAVFGEEREPACELCAGEARPE